MLRSILADSSYRLLSPFLLTSMMRSDRQPNNNDYASHASGGSVLSRILRQLYQCAIHSRFTRIKRCKFAACESDCEHRWIRRHRYVHSRRVAEHDHDCKHNQQCPECMAIRHDFKLGPYEKTVPAICNHILARRHTRICPN